MLKTWGHDHEYTQITFVTKTAQSDSIFVKISYLHILPRVIHHFVRFYLSDSNLHYIENSR